MSYIIIITYPTSENFSREKISKVEEAGAEQLLGLTFPS